MGLVGAVENGVLEIGIRPGLKSESKVSWIVCRCWPRSGLDRATVLVSCYLKSSRENSWGRLSDSGV